MSTSPVTMLGTSHLGTKQECGACGAGSCLSFNWRYAVEHGSADNERRTNFINVWRELRHGKLYRCSVCEEVWYLDKDADWMTHVESERLPLIHEWSLGVSVLSADALVTVQNIGPTPPDIYGNGSKRRVTPCEVVTHSGECFDKAMICVQTDAPVENDLRFRLGSEIAQVNESPFALPRSVREASSQAEEMRMGFSPTLIEMPDGCRFVLNGAASFMITPGYTALEARIVDGSYFSEHSGPRLVGKRQAEAVQAL